MRRIKQNLIIFILFFIFLLNINSISFATNDFSIKGYIDSFKTNAEVNGELAVARMGYERL